MLKAVFMFCSGIYNYTRKKKRLVVLTTASGWLPWLHGLHVFFRGISDCVYISEPIMFIKMVFSCSLVDGRAQFSLY